MWVNYFFFAFWAHQRADWRIKLDRKGTAVTHSHNGFIVGPLHYQGYRSLGFPLQASLHRNFQNSFDVHPGTISAII